LEKGLQSAFSAHDWMIVAFLKRFHCLKLSLIEFLVLFEVKFVQHVVEWGNLRVHIPVVALLTFLVVERI